MGRLQAQWRVIVATKISNWAIIAPALLVLMIGGAQARPLMPGQNRAADPLPTATAGELAYCVAVHNVGKIVLGQTNYGVFGNGYVSGSSIDCFTGVTVASCEYPKGASTNYLYGATFWIGAVVGRDTMVSIGADGWQRCREFNPEESPIGDMQFKSIIDPSKPEYLGAKSEQDYIGVYTDKYTSGVPDLCNTTNDPVNGIGHRPLNIEIEERSYAWSYSYAEDFVLFDYSIKNIGYRDLTSVYMGIYVDADVSALGDNNGPNDDVCGFLLDVPSPPVFSGGCAFRDTVNLAYIADNDADWDKPTNLPDVTGTRIVRTPNDTLDVSFNWWIGNTQASKDFGPMRIDSYRNLGTGGLGTPEGDRNKYAFLRNKEFDYDQAFTCRYALTPGWVPVPQELCQLFSKGFDTRYLLSFGPFDIKPGDNLPLSFAYVGGQGLHRTDRKSNGKNLTDPAKYDPETWYENLDFSDLALNAVWASWVYDNPGVSNRDGGFRGKFRICVHGDKADTIYYTGDGEPDFRGASPPPAPDIWIYPSDRELRVRFNGFRSETSKDVFARVADFEGYRVYLSLDDRPASFSLVESYDREDFNKWVFNPGKSGGAGYELKENPFTRHELDSLYGNGDPNWNPLNYPATSPFHLGDSLFYFAAQDYNRSRLGTETRITKIYPDAVRPPYIEPDSVPAGERALYLTDDNEFKYYEYQMVISGLLPSIPYFVNVTAFDFGSPSSGLASLETSPTIGYQSSYAVGSAARGTSTSDQVYVFPNPYRVDGGYQSHLYEGRDSYSRSKAPDRQRRVHFANVPLHCTIKIFTVDGDLVKEIHHPDPQSPCPEDPTVTCWDLITRNTQLAVSGLYYWTVEDEAGSVQIGKLVLVM